MVTLRIPLHLAYDNYSKGAILARMNLHAAMAQLNPMGWRRASMKNGPTQPGSRPEQLAVMLGIVAPPRHETSPRKIQERKIIKMARERMRDQYIGMREAFHRRMLKR